MLDDREFLGNEFPIRDRLIYLNSASIGIVPESSLRAVEAFNRRYQDESINDDGRTFAVVDSCRQKLGRLIGASVDEIAFMPNTSYGVNTAALSLGLCKGDNLIVPKGEFPANVLPWKMLERFGVEVRLIDPRPSSDDILAAIDRNTRCIAISMISFGDGFRPDIAAISQITRDRDIILFVDGIQALGNLPVNVEDMGIDILASGGQKRLISPWGSGFLYISRRIMDRLKTPMEGWLSRFPTRDFTDLLDYNLPQPEDATRFEVGTLPFSAIIGMDSSLDILLDIGIEQIFSHSQNLKNRLLEDLPPAFKALDTGLPSSILSIGGEKTKELHRRLLAKKIIHSLREGHIRLAFHLYNTMDEVERVMGVIRQTG